MLAFTDIAEGRKQRNSLAAAAFIISNTPYALELDVNRMKRVIGEEKIVKYDHELTKLQMMSIKARVSPRINYEDIRQYSILPR